MKVSSQHHSYQTEWIYGVGDLEKYLTTLKDVQAKKFGVR